MAGHEEIELKFDASPAQAAAIEASPLLAGSPGRRVRLRSVYFDLPDQALRAAGLSLRIREEAGQRTQTLKVGGAPNAGLFARREWNRIVDQDHPVIDDAMPLRTLIGGFDATALSPVFDVRVERAVHVLRSDDATVELAIDHAIVSTQENSESFCEIELELMSGAPAALFHIARKLGLATDGGMGVLSKAERGYRLDATEGRLASKAAPVALDATLSSAAAFQALAAACVRQFLLNGTVLRAYDHSDALHQARVALRRLRSMMWVFRKVASGTDRDRIYQELRWLAGQLGDARGIDVLAAQGDDDRRKILRQARAHAYVDARKALDSARGRQAIFDLVEWTAVGEWTTDADKAELRDRPVAITAITALDRLRRRIKQAGNLEKLEDADRHKVRISAKKLRYACDYFAQLFPGKKARKQAKLFAKMLEKLQDRLGRLNDIAVAPDIIRRLGDHVDAAALPALTGKGNPVPDDLIAKAEKARKRLVRLKRFWR